VGVPAPDEDREAFGDEGARTDLAWSRSGLALAVASASVLKVLVDIGSYSAPVIVAAILAAVVLAWGMSITYSRYIAKGSLEGQPLSGQRKFKVVAAMTTIFGLVAMVIALVPAR
jgi:hypothetical protein